ncbi:MAG: 2Fe-2S iron-sulfur cluster-binding protein [Ignavibacteriae bacterium]|nr:2Fe-2S iron-sulfur cluster-binding protein [Ignavibacteriota bacterium]
MAKVIFLPLNNAVFASKDKSLLDLAFENDIVIEHNCGGLCACTSCRVIIKKGISLLKEKCEEEKNLLCNAGFFENKYRLSCQCVIQEESEKEIIVEIPQ